VLEQRLREGRRGPQVRPFCQTADIGQRDYSRSLQRALVDFGADDTVDFYHVDEHLGKAADCIAPARKKEWLHQQHGLLLENKVTEVLQSLEAHFEPLEQKQPPVRGTHQYLEKRKDHLDYAGARAAGLPIGSGEVESGHRHVIQQRLKIAGAWWTLPNAEAMLQLRTTRANHDWNRYWTDLAKN